MFVCIRSLTGRHIFSRNLRIIATELDIYRLLLGNKTTSITVWSRRNRK
jgi:hypothetical protein